MSPPTFGELRASSRSFQQTAAARHRRTYALNETKGKGEAVEARSTERHAIQKADIERPLPKHPVSVLLQEVSVLRLTSIACEASRGYTLSASAAQFPERSGSGQRPPRRPVADAKGKSPAGSASARSLSGPSSGHPCIECHPPLPPIAPYFLLPEAPRKSLPSRATVSAIFCFCLSAVA